MPDIKTLYEKALADKAAGKNTDLAIDVYGNAIRKREQEELRAAERAARGYHKVVETPEEIAARKEEWRIERERVAARERRELLENQAVGEEELRGVALLLPFEFILRYGWLVSPLVIAGLIFKQPEAVPREWMVLAAASTPLLGAFWMWLRAQLTPRSRVISRFHLGHALLYAVSGVLAAGIGVASFSIVHPGILIGMVFFGGVIFLFNAAWYGLS